MDAPHISKPVLGFFRYIVRGYFRRHFHAVRVSNAAAFTSLAPGPLIVYANHSSWWDPMVCVLLAQRCMPRRRHFAPMDADALERYSILKRIGIFGVEMKTARGAAQFLRTGLAILKAGGVLWITPQGRFADARDPLIFKPGMAALAARVKEGCTLLPLAIEYPFWDERLPEVLLHFGDPIHTGDTEPAALDERLRSGLAQAMDTLKEKAIARDPRGFDPLLKGSVGTGGFYHVGQRGLAWLRGRTFQPEHTRMSPQHPGENE